MLTVQNTERINSDERPNDLTHPRKMLIINKDHICLVKEHLRAYQRAQVMKKEHMIIIYKVVVDIR